MPVKKLPEHEMDKKFLYLQPLSRSDAAWADRAGRCRSGMARMPSGRKAPDYR
jgi:hypothetical protein